MSDAGALAIAALGATVAGAAISFGVGTLVGIILGLAAALAVYHWGLLR